MARVIGGEFGLPASGSTFSKTKLSVSRQQWVTLHLTVAKSVRKIFHVTVFVSCSVRHVANMAVWKGRYRFSSLFHSLLKLRSLCAVSLLEYATGCDQGGEGTVKVMKIQESIRFDFDRYRNAGTQC